MKTFLQVRRIALAICLCGLAGCLSDSPSQKTSGKKLIEFGWDEPDTAFMRQHIAEMERTPFEGCVFHPTYRQADGKTGAFIWEAWSKRAFTAAELQPALDDLKATPLRRFKHNFLRFNTTPGDVDWFDAFGPILNNARLAARIAREGKCKGLLFDIEQYNAQLFDYHKQRDAARKSWAEYAAQARVRGREVMEAFQQSYPGLTVFLTFGYSLPWSQSDGGKKPLAEGGYGLLAPFLDGMVDGAKGRTRIVDGFEISYGYRKPKHFDKGRQIVTKSLLPIVADPKKYAQVFSMSFGLWIDYDWRSNGWNTNDFSKNPITPAILETIARNALEVADQYVWIYTEKPRWWSAEGKPVELPEEYQAALRRAKNFGK